MEIRVEKLVADLKSTTGKQKNFHLDNTSDPDYIYVVVEGHYIVRIPAVLSADEVDQLYAKGYGGSYCRPFRGAEDIIDKVLEDEHIFHFKEINENGLAVFNYDDGKEAYFNPKFFKAYFNGLLSKKGFPDNILFSGIDNQNPMVMWENDVAIAVFLPIKYNAKI